MSRIVLLGGLMLGGCYRVPVVVDPASASLVEASGTSQAVPTEVRVSPLRKKVQVVAPGHRTLDLTLRWSPLDYFRRKSAREVEVQLIEEHGPAGTWER